MITSTFDTRLGEVTVSIDDGGSIATFKTLEFATIDFDFDITPDETDIDRVSVFYGRFQIKADNKDSLGNDLYNRFRSNITEFTSVDMDVVVDRGAETNWEFSYKMSRGDLELSELTRKVTIKGTAKIDIAPTMGELAPADPFFYYGVSTMRWDAISVGNFISQFVDALNPNLDSVIQHASNISVEVSNPIYKTFDDADISSMSSESALCLLDLPTGVFESIEDEDIEDFTQFRVAASLAASEGSIFGTGFDRNFWVYRNATGSPVTVPWSDVINLNDIELVQAFRSVSVGTRQYNIKPTFYGIPYLGIEKGVHLSLQQWNHRAPKRFQFVDTPGIFFVSEFKVPEKVSSVFEIISVPVFREDLIIYLGAEGSTTINTVDGDAMSTANAIALKINNTFSDWEAEVFGGGNINPYMRLNYVGAGTGVGQNIDITKDPTGIPDMEYSIMPYPTALTPSGFDATGRASNDLRIRALQAYSKVFPVGETFKISGTMRNFVKPWQTFQFSGAPSRYSGKEFRLSRAGYDLFQYKLNFTAYEVG